MEQTKILLKNKKRFVYLKKKSYLCAFFGSFSTQKNKKYGNKLTQKYYGNITNY